MALSVWIGSTGPLEALLPNRRPNSQLKHGRWFGISGPASPLRNRVRVSELSYAPLKRFDKHTSAAAAAALLDKQRFSFALRITAGVVGASAGGETVWDPDCTCRVLFSAKRVWREGCKLSECTSGGYNVQCCFFNIQCTVRPKQPSKLSVCLSHWNLRFHPEVQSVQSVQSGSAFYLVICFIQEYLSKFC